MQRILIFRLTGKAERVFSLIDYFSKSWGHITLGQILKMAKGKSIPTFIEKV